MKYDVAKEVNRIDDEVFRLESKRFDIIEKMCFDSTDDEEYAALEAEVNRLEREIKILWGKPLEKSSPTG